MKKKLLASILALSIVTTGAVTTAACVGGSDKQPTNTIQTGTSVGQVTDDTGTVMGDAVNAMPTRMTFRNARALTNASEYDSVTIQATVKPDNATNKNVTWSVAFVDPASSWATGKTVTDYVTVTPQSEGSNVATVECLQPFGEQIKITVTSQSNASAKAECTLDFAKRISKAPLYVHSHDNDYEHEAADFSDSALYLDISLDWKLWWDEPHPEYTVYTVDEDFECTFEIFTNEDVLAQFNADTGMFVEPAILEEDTSMDIIYDTLLNALDGVDWTVASHYNTLNNWLMSNTDKALFTVKYKAVGLYSTYEAEVPIYLDANALEVVVASIMLNQTNIVI